ncbi:TRAP transporter large permease [Pseudemcibacter aquimaris]|uniref:TRAP transporter large permease n=1 Tax=Pseudemcibacter aquimaris TaxID=2857064 RepID=UPI00201152AF|nr:TRAP transporter large permease subunit [Pseudemcibacter aquimaris]MCC3860790.1 TRAP transporter large permease subunit [Pseudemcibacter aquimaris]WDU59610.1 TRAP transporter large permease subunit [Pseudemcibacter aquimaris]
MIDLLPLFMFPVLAIFLFSGYPVAFVLGGVGLMFGLIGMGFDVFNFKEFFLINSRIFGGVVENIVLIAIPMFVFMGLILERSGIAKELLHSLQVLTRRAPGGLAMSVTLLGTIMAATTGIIGASVVMISLMAFPAMLKAEYDKNFTSGTIAAAGTLGILIPPSIMLVIMGDLLSISVTDLFMTALIPGLMLASFYLIYIIFKNRGTPAPESIQDKEYNITQILNGFLPAVILISLVLGSIFTGLATPTEAAGVGAFGALLLALIKKKMTRAKFWETCDETINTSGMIFGIFVGATAFSYVFRSLGGDDLIIHFMNNFDGGPWIVISILMILVFILGFFFDWIEITLIVLPIFAPILNGLDLGGHVETAQVLPWFAILVAINLQTSFLTPPFGFALFYMKGVAPKEIRMQNIYKGVIPYIIIQLIGLLLIMAFPAIALWLPTLLNQ